MTTTVGQRARAIGCRAAAADHQHLDDAERRYIAPVITHIAQLGTAPQALHLPRPMSAVEEAVLHLAVALAERHAGRLLPVVLQPRSQRQLLLPRHQLPLRDAGALWPLAARAFGASKRGWRRARAFNSGMPK